LIALAIVTVTRDAGGNGAKQAVRLQRDQKCEEQKGLKKRG
jgi:hypothetical protein